MFVKSEICCHFFFHFYFFGDVSDFYIVWKIFSVARVFHHQKIPSNIYIIKVHYKIQRKGKGKVLFHFYLQRNYYLSSTELNVSYL